MSEKGEIIFMEKERYSFIIEFDEMTDKQMKDLTNYFDDTKIKFQVLKSDYELKKQKEIIDKAREYINVDLLENSADYLKKTGGDVPGSDLPACCILDLLDILEDKEV